MTTYDDAAQCGTENALIVLRQNEAGASRAVCPDCDHVTPWVESAVRAFILLDAYHARRNA